MDRTTLITELLDELTQHGPAAKFRAMRHWPAGRLSLVHLNVLSNLDGDGPLPMRSLAESMDVSQASATGIVDRMEQRGLVERQRDDEDRRVVRVALTDEGRNLIAGMAAERREHVKAILDTLTDEEIAGLLLGTRAMRRARELLHATHPAAPETRGATAAAHAAPAAPETGAATPATHAAPATPPAAPVDAKPHQPEAPR